jgi:hypothetical protein
MLHTHTLRICNTYCSSTATIFARTRLTVTLYIYCLTCYSGIYDIYECIYMYIFCILVLGYETLNTWNSSNISTFKKTIINGLLHLFTFLGVSKNQSALHIDTLCLWESIYIWGLLTNVNFYLGMWRRVCLLRNLTANSCFLYGIQVPVESHLYRYF